MTRPRALALTLLLWALPAGLSGQASQFGVRSLGIPLLPVSAATQGTGGGFALFDPEWNAPCRSSHADPGWPLPNT